MANDHVMNNDRIDIDSEIIETVIGADTKFVGSVNTTKPIRIDGEFEGDIVSDDAVVVSEIGKFKGTIQCETLILDGHGEGELTCTELCQFAPIGVFSGNIATKNLVLVAGSKFDGNLKML